MIWIPSSPIPLTAGCAQGGVWYGAAVLHWIRLFQEQLYSKKQMQKEKEQNLVRLQGRWQGGIIEEKPSHNHELVRACRACLCTPGSHAMSNWDVSVGQKDTVTLGMWWMWATHQWGSADLTISRVRLDLPTKWLQNNQVQCRTTMAKAINPLLYW